MFYTRCAYAGQSTKDKKRMHGRGIFTFSNGNKFVGTFHDGAFHGEGIVFFTKTNGGGQYRGVWDMGKAVRGDYIFCDGLEFATQDWGHCTSNDRRFWDEYLTFIHPPAASDRLPHVTPDYSTTDGIPPAFSEGKPRGQEDIRDTFWENAPAAVPEHEGKLDPHKKKVEGEPDMATLIAKAKVEADGEQ